MLPPEFGYEYPHSARSCNLSPCNVRNTPLVTVISPRELGSYFTAALTLSYTRRQLSVHQKSGYSSSSSFLEYVPIIAQCFPFVNRYFQFFSEISRGRRPRRSMLMHNGQRKKGAQCAPLQPLSERRRIPRFACYARLLCTSSLLCFRSLALINA